MAEEKRFFWLKLKENFFDEKYIKALRRLPQGDSLVIVYLKMQLKSLKTEGIIKYEGILPDSISELALVLDEDENIVKLTVEALVRYGVIERWENETFYMSAMQQLIGSETQAAARVRKHREAKALQCNGNVTKCNTEIEKEIDKEIDNISVEFETLWKMYPRKVGKEAALRAYKKARSDKKDPTTFEQVKQGIENYIRQIEAKHTDTQYIKHGSSWFNARAWKDDYDFSPAKQFSSSPQLVTVNGKEYELRNGKYYTPGGCGIAVDPYAKSDLDDLF